MQAVENKIKGLLNGAMGYSVLMIVIGLVLLIFPGLSLDILRWTLAISMIATGIYMIASDLTRVSIGSMFTGSVGGVLLLAMGAIVAMYPQIMEIIPIILGLWMIVSSVFSLRLSASLRGMNSYWTSTIMSIISIICGVVLIWHPFAGTIALMSFIGIMLIVFAISSLIELITLRSNLQTISSYFKNGKKFIDIEPEDSSKKSKNN